MDITTLAGRETSRIGLGCGRLVGGSGARASRQLVEAARALGIRHFDTAPSYGLGTSENVLGDVLAGDGAVTIVTKVGIGRPSNPGLRALVRQVVRPLLASRPGLKARLARQAGAGQLRGQFAPEQMRASLNESLRRLQREFVDGLLLHQPEADQLTQETNSALATFIRDGKVRAIGSGTGGDREAIIPIGTITQFRAAVGIETKGDENVILHGVLRRWPAPQDAAWRTDILRRLGRDPADPSGWVGVLLSYVLSENPSAIVLLSASTPERLRAAVSAVDWAFVRSPPADVMAEMRIALVQ